MIIAWKLFFVFFKIGLLSIGGGYAVISLIQEQVVENTGWISEKMFTDIITLSQMTPGPLAGNTSTFVGLQIGGFPGALAATIGCILCGIIISLALYDFFQSHRTSDHITEILNGLKSASLGLIISAAFTIILLALYGNSRPVSFSSLLMFQRAPLFIFVIMLFLLRKRKTNPLIILLISGFAGLVFYS